jgi:hypothetical protein
MKTILFRSSLAISFLLLVATLASRLPCSYTSEQQNHPINLTEAYKNEAFDQELAKIKSIDEFKLLIRSEVHRKKLSGLEIPALVDKYVRSRFHHGHSMLKPCDNWFNNFSNILLTAMGYENLLWSAFIPEDIMRFEVAICSQQQWVFQEIIKDYQMDYASVAFNTARLGHIASSVKFDGTWYYYDPNMEPTYKDTNPPLLKHILEGNREVLEGLYKSTRGGTFDVTPWVEGAKLNLITQLSINQHSQPKFLFLQTTAKIISNWGWLIFLSLGLLIKLSLKIRAPRVKHLK